MINNILNDFAKLLFVIIALVMMIELIMAFILFNMTKQFISNSRTVKAKILKLEIFNKGAKAYISFKDPLGNTLDTTIRVQLNKYKENQDIEILSHKANPSKVKLNSALSLWILPRIMLYSFVMLGIALGIMVAFDAAKWPF